MTAAHVHLILTHVPIVGVAFAAALFVVAWSMHSGPFQRVALWFLVLFALITIPLYLTGEPAEETVERLPGVAESVIDPHEEAGERAFIAAEGLGALALLGALVFRNRLRIPASFAAAVVVLSLVTSGLFVYAGYLGGQIRRPELLPGGAAAGPEQARPGEREDGD